MKFKNDNELLEDFTTTRNLKQITKETYHYSIQLYTQFNNKNFPSLLKEAESEEDEGIRWKYRRIKKRLIQFRYFLTQNYKKNYVKSTFSRIITLYKHYEIEIHDLPPLSTKNTNETEPLTYNDLPTKKTIQKALRFCDHEMKALVLFMVSSGCARRETLNITVNDFILATKEYHNTENIFDVIKLLKNRNDIVPVWKLKRQKTNKYYYTFNSPEATKQIIKHLQKRKNLKNTDKIFDLNPSQLTFKFQKINKKLKLGKHGNYNVFRSHILRKYHASHLLNDGMSLTDINSMQGKTKNSTDEAYFFENPSKLKEKYIKHLHSITIISKSVKKVKSAEIIRLEIENNELKKEIKRLNKELDTVKSGL